MIKSLNLKSVLSVSGAAGLFLVVLWLVPHTPEPAYRLFQDGTGYLVVSLAHLLGLSAQYNPTNFYFDVAGFDMRLMPECVALHYLAILSVAILLTPGQGWRRKLVAWVCCSSALVLCNVLRLIFLGVIGHEFPVFFNAVHDYVWQVAFAIFTVFLCLVWVQPGDRQFRHRGSVLLYSLAFSAFFALAFNAVKIQYLNGLAWLADKFLLLANGSLPWKSRWWLVTQKSFVMVRLEGEKVFYHLPTRQYSVSLWSDMLGLVLFWGFCVGSLFWFLQHGQKVSHIRAGFGILSGTLLLSVTHLFAVLLLGLMLLSGAEMDLGSNFLWLVRGLSVLLPVACWWLFWRAQYRPHQEYVFK